MLLDDRMDALWLALEILELIKIDEMAKAVGLRKGCMNTIPSEKNENKECDVWSSVL